MRPHLAILCNPKSGSHSLDKKSIKALFKNVKATTDYFSVKSELGILANQLETHKYDVLVAVGGDGTVNAGATLAVKFNVPLGVLPAGTLNHFAKDLGIPLKLQDAVSAVVNGSTIHIDYGMVNGRVFVNNSSIGMYPATVIQREALQTKIGKWPAAFVVSVRALFRISATHLTLKTPRGNYRLKTPLLFVGNNSYKFFEKKGFINRTHLNSGKLYLYAIRANRMSAIIRTMVLIFLGRRPKQGDFVQHTPGPIIVQSRKKVIDVAVDGEVTSLHPPLTYSIYAGSLKVRVASKNPIKD